MKRQASLALLTFFLAFAMLFSTGTVSYAVNTDATVKFSPYEFDEADGSLTFHGYLYNVGNTTVNGINSLTLETFNAETGEVYASKIFVTDELEDLVLQPGGTHKISFTIPNGNTPHGPFNVRTRSDANKGPAHYTEGVHVFVNQQALKTDVAPVIVNGRTLVPLRSIFEQLGMTVEWNAETSTARATSMTHTITHQVGTNVLNVDGRAVTLDVGSQILDGRTMVPLRAISQSVGSRVFWGSENGAMTIAIIN